MRKTTNDILKGINDKNYAAWEDLYAKFYRSLCSYAFNILKDLDTSKDVVQDVLIKIWQSSVVFNTENELVAYLYRSVYNNSVIYMRNSGNRTCILTEIHKETTYLNTATSGLDVEFDSEFLMGVVSEEVIRELHTSIADLPRDRQEVIKLSIEGHTGQEIAKLLGVSINTVKTQKYRSYRFLKDRLKHFFISSTVTE